MYDQETGLYYLQSRYYDPELGRFLNADALYSTGQGFIGNNMFAYCGNNPANYIDVDGRNPLALQWSTTMWWLCTADTALPIGDVIYASGFLLLSIFAYESSNNAVPKVVYDGGASSPAPKNPNNNDDKDDDDYWDDDSNFGSKQKVGKKKTNTPGDNKAQNKQFRDATKGLPKAIKQQIHNMISGKDLGYWEIRAIADEFRAVTQHINHN